MESKRRVGYGNHSFRTKRILLFSTQTKKIDAHPYVLDNGLATMIYMFQSEGMIVFLDRIFTYNDCVNQDWEGYHAQIYSKIALDMKLRMTLC